MKIFIDSNIFIRVFTSDNEKQAKECLNFFKFIENGNSNLEAYISKIVVMEVGWVLGGECYKFSKTKIVNALRSMEANNIHWENGIDFEKGLDIFEKYNVKLGDAMIAAGDAVQKKKAVIVSYDKDFDKIDGVVRVTPREVLEKVK